MLCRSSKGLLMADRMISLGEWLIEGLASLRVFVSTAST
jgi:hypothetical protein